MRPTKFIKVQNSVKIVEKKEDYSIFKKITQVFLKTAWFPFPSTDFL
jgi:hypothetical protein